MKRKNRTKSEDVSTRKSKRKHNETTEDVEGDKGVEGVHTRNEGARTRNTRSVKSKSTPAGNNEVDMEDVDGMCY